MDDTETFDRDLEDLTEAIRARDEEALAMKVERFNEENPQLAENTEFTQLANAYLENGIDPDLAIDMARDDLVRQAGKTEIPTELMTTEEMAETLNAEEFKNAARIRQDDEFGSERADPYKKEKEVTASDFRRINKLAYGKED
jgi:hypothetical protein